MKRVRDDGYECDDDRARIDVDAAYRWVSEESYWSKGIPRQTFERAMAGARPFGIYAPDGAQVGYARVISDGATFGYIGDVFVVPSHRKRGLSKFLMETIQSHPDPYGQGRRA